MMPRDSVYGDWPASGEIDIVESKGNVVQNVKDETRNTVRSSLHWGPASGLDRYLKTTDVIKREFVYCVSSSVLLHAVFLNTSQVALRLGSWLTWWTAESRKWFNEESNVFGLEVSRPLIRGPRRELTCSSAVPVGFQRYFHLEGISSSQHLRYPFFEAFLAAWRLRRSHRQRSDLHQPVGQRYLPQSCSLRPRLFLDPQRKSFTCDHAFEAPS